MIYLSIFSSQYYEPSLYIMSIINVPSIVNGRLESTHFLFAIETINVALKRPFFSAKLQIRIKSFPYFFPCRRMEAPAEPSEDQRVERVLSLIHI